MGNDKKPKRYSMSKDSTANSDPNLDKFLGELADWEEANKGGKGGGNQWGTNRPYIKSRDEAVAFYKKEYLPKVSNMPKGLQYKALQAAINTGRHKGFALKAAGYYDSKGDVTEKGKAAGITGTLAENSDGRNDKYYDRLASDINKEYDNNPGAFKENYGAASDYHYANAKWSDGRTFNEAFGDFHNKEYDISSKYDKDLDGSTPAKQPATTAMDKTTKPKYSMSGANLVDKVNTLVRPDGIYKQYPDGKMTYTKNGGQEEHVGDLKAQAAIQKLDRSFVPTVPKSQVHDPLNQGDPNLDPTIFGERPTSPAKGYKDAESQDLGFGYKKPALVAPTKVIPEDVLPVDKSYAQEPIARLENKGYNFGKPLPTTGEPAKVEVPGSTGSIESGPGIPELDNKREFNPGRLTNIAYNMLTANSPVDYPKLGRFMPEAYQYADMSATKRKALIENRNYMTKAMQGSVNRGVSQGNLAGISAQHIGAMEAVNEGEAQRAMQLKLANVDMKNKAQEYNLGKGDQESIFKSQAEGLKHQAGQAAAVETAALAQATDIEKGMQRQDQNRYNMDKWTLESGLVGTAGTYYDENGVLRTRKGYKPAYATQKRGNYNWNLDPKNDEIQVRSK